MKYNLTEACAECPFVKGHGAKGFTGPYKNALELHQAVMSDEYHCHTSETDSNGRSVPRPKQQQCVGAQMYRAQNCKSMRDFDPRTQAHQTLVLACNPGWKKVTWTQFELCANDKRVAAMFKKAP